MGTSASHPSPPTLGWSMVAAAYTSPTVPVDRIVAEVWRASQSQPEPIFADLASPLIFECQENVRTSASASEALARLNRVIFTAKAASFISELAKRAAVPAFGSDDRAQGWRENFFAQVTDYMVSRDLSGYVGPQYRNQNVSQLVEFKATLINRVREIVRSLPSDPRSSTSWQSYVAQVTERLSQLQR